MKKLIFLAILAININLQAQAVNKYSTVSVTGEGIVKVVPDQVSVKIRIENTGKSAIDVKQENDRVIDGVLKFCKQLKIDKKEVNTTRVNLNKNYDYQKKMYNYVANQSLTIRLKDLNKYEELIQGLLDVGINRIDGVEFKSSKIDEYRAEARIKAVKNAKEKAVLYAGVLDQEIGMAITISENPVSSYNPRPQMMEFKSASVEFDGASETLAVGEMQVKAIVSIVFELK